MSKRVSADEQVERLEAGEDPDTVHIPKEDLANGAKPDKSKKSKSPPTPGQGPYKDGPCHLPGLRVYLEPRYRDTPSKAPLRHFVVHALRFLKPGSKVNADIVARNLPDECWAVSLPRKQQLDYVRTELNNLSFRRSRHQETVDREHGSVKYRGEVPDQQPTSTGAIAQYGDAGMGKRGPKPYPRCLARLDPGQYEITPEVFEPQTEAERIYGFPEEATYEPPSDPRVDLDVVNPWAHRLGIDLQSQELKWHLSELLRKLGI